MRKKGFTLIELLIYTVIVGGFLAVAAVLAMQIIQGGIKARALRELRDNADFAMIKISQAIKNSEELENIKDPGDSDSELELKFQDSENIRFELSQDKIIMQEGSGSALAITSDSVSISSLIFTNISFENKLPVVKVKINLENNDASTTIENTIALRFND